MFFILDIILTDLEWLFSFLVYPWSQSVCNLHQARYNEYNRKYTLTLHIITQIPHNFRRIFALVPLHAKTPTHLLRQPSLRYLSKVLGIDFFPEKRLSNEEKRNSKNSANRSYACNFWYLLIYFIQFRENGDYNFVTPALVAITWIQQLFLLKVG